MTFSEAKAALIDGYSKQRIQISKITQKTILLEIPNFDVPIKISQSDISNYQKYLDETTKYAIKPNECSIIYTDYRESLISITSSSERYRLMNNPLNDAEYYFGTKEGQKIYAEISAPSNLFHNYFRFEDVYIKRFRFMGHRFRRAKIDKLREIGIKETFPELSTIKIFRLKERNIEKAIDLSNQIIDSCIFTLMYKTNYPITISKDWGKKEVRKYFDYKNEPYQDSFPINMGVIDSDLVKLYNRGLSTNDPYIQFISYYQILEKYFLDVSDKRIYSRLKMRLNTPSFQQNKKHLNYLIQEAVTGKNNSDEKEMLKLVIEYFFENEEIINFIEEYEKFLDKKTLTKSGKIFGEELRVNFHKDHLISSLAKRIKTIRNCLIHSSDTHDRKDRYVPGKETDETLRNEIPLMKFLAEKIIIGSYDFIL